MLPKVKCPVCEKYFYREEEEHIKKKNRYIHKKCILQESELEDYIKELYKTNNLPEKVKKQIQKYVNDGMTHFGIRMSLIYHYEVKKGDLSKSNGGIGIVPYVYSEAGLYYKKLESNKVNATVDDINKFVNHVKIKIRPPEAHGYKEEIDISNL